MRTWTINSITIIEQAHDHDLHSFAVYHGGDYLGTIYPDSVDDMRQCIAALDNGADPIADGWEDGNGNVCTLDGWANLDN